MLLTLATNQARAFCEAEPKETIDSTQIYYSGLEELGSDINPSSTSLIRCLPLSICICFIYLCA